VRFNRDDPQAGVASNDVNMNSGDQSQLINQEQVGCQCLVSCHHCQR
jgi:hypothetical protein